MQRSSRARRRSIAGFAIAWLVALVAISTLAPVVAASSAGYVANCDVKLRATPATSANVFVVIATGTVVVADGTVTGDSWAADCGSSVAGNTWLAVTSVGGSSVSSLYGVSHVYAASGLFHVQVVNQTWLQGVDVSHYQGTINYAQVAAAGKSFVIAKATEGIGYTDPNWTKNLAAATAAGLKVTGYHFARPDGNPTKPVQEADWFVSQLALAPGMIVPALDLERSGGMSPSALQAWVGAWLGEVYAKTGVRPMIYTSPSFWGSHRGNTAMFANQGYKILWVAHWFVGNPTVPGNNWGGKGWTFWQYDDCGSVPGITTGCVDLDRYHNTDFTSLTYGADFHVAAGTASSSVKQGHGASIGVALARTWFTLPIGMTVTGLPAGATASISPASATGSSATLTVSTSAATPLGTYPLTVTGVGNGLTRKATSTLVVTDGIPPTVAAPISQFFYQATVGSTTMPVRTSWSATDPAGIGSYTFEQSLNGGAWSIRSLPSPTSTSLTQSLTFGSSYRFVTRATDGAGNVSGWVYGPTFKTWIAQETAPTYAGAWTSSLVAAASGGGVKSTVAKGASAQYTF
ncbi:MAG: lysozyme, partial [Chloroflexota bacterium]|nr:lysozyme [Chloroflexota bacterium]